MVELAAVVFLAIVLGPTIFWLFCLPFRAVGALVNGIDGMFFGMRCKACHAKFFYPDQRYCTSCGGRI